MKFRQIGLHVSNLDRAIDFYKKVLQKEPIAKFDPLGFAFFDLSGVRLFLDVNAPKSAVYLKDFAGNSVGLLSRETINETRGDNK